MTPTKKTFQKSASALAMTSETAASQPTGPAHSSAGSSRNTSPPNAPAASSSSTPLSDQAKNVLAQLVKTSKLNRARGSALAERPEVQAMLDKDLFLIQSDRRTKMNPLQQLQMVRVLAQFFLERVDDGHRYAYFKAIFLGRTDDSIINEYRISVLFQLVSFSVQYPVLQIINHFMGWLSEMKNEDQQRMYSDRLVEMIVEHFIRNSNDTNKLHQFLLPLDNTCSEFCALFVARAPLHCPFDPPMMELFVRFCTRNMQFILRHLRDTPWLGNEFAEKVIPKMVEKALTDTSTESDCIASCLCYFFFRWHLDVQANNERKGPSKRIEVIDLILSPQFTWTKRRACLLTCAIGASGKDEESIQKELLKVDVPDDFKPVLTLLCAKGVKENCQKTMDTVSEMKLNEESDESDQ